MPSKGRVVVAMSGGVDSSVAALLLKEQGYDVVGVTMRLWSEERTDLPPLSKRCCSVEDVDDARRVCDKIGVPHYFLNFEREFKAHVIDYFCREYETGRTPHPCLACNDKIKFDFLLRRALFMDAEYIATGHYARVAQNGSGKKLLKARDSSKDQSYVLFTLRQQELERILLPVGDLTKTEIRKLAAKAGLPVADKPDSQEICFIPDNDYRGFISRMSVPMPGEVVDINGNVLGRHSGIQFFTIGQRRKLGLSGGTGEPIFVVDINTERNRIVVGPEDKLYKTTLWASGVNYVSGHAPENPIEVTAKIRYKATEALATLIPQDGWVEMRFDRPQRAVTPGQAVVFYRGEEVVGGGIIETKAPSN